jgi:hypothetical protein
MEDFTEFEQRTVLQRRSAPAPLEGMNILDRIQVAHIAQMLNMFDFPAGAQARRERPTRRRPRHRERTPQRRALLRQGGAPPATRPRLPGPLNARLEARTVSRQGSGGSDNTFTLCGIKDSRPYLQRWPRADAGDTVEFFISRPRSTRRVRVESFVCPFYASWQGQRDGGLS